MKRAKTDKVNSKIIAEYGFKEDVRLFTPKDEYRGVIELKQKAIEDFHKQINILQNQLHSLKYRPQCTKNLRDLMRKASSYLKNLKRNLKRRFKILL